jgi:hypothetical protein
MKTTKSLFGIFTITASLAMQVQAQLFLTNGLVAYYPLNGNANDQFDSANSGILENGAFYTNGIAGEPNSAVYCDGINGYVYFGKNDAIYPNQVLTWSVWFKAEAFSGYIFWDDDSQPGGDRGIDLSSTSVFAGSAGNFIQSPNPAPLYQWVQAVYTSDVSGQCLYLNGTLVTNNNVIIADHAGRSSVSVGAGNCTCGGPNYAYGDRFQGAISKVRLYNRALSSNEVAQLYANESELIPIVNIQKAVYITSGNLWIGTNYQVQISPDMINWANSGSVFTATNSVWQSTNYWNVSDWNQIFFRLQVNP